MKKFLLLSSVLFAFVVSGPVFADEVGPAKPTSSSTQPTTSASTEGSPI
ncbi:MAG: hypothetical protein KY410_07925 [Proteobacteria bacterium]|nr:hypothetical protein [Pseudomonadota bacterium]